MEAQGHGVSDFKIGQIWDRNRHIGKRRFTAVHDRKRGEIRPIRIDLGNDAAIYFLILINVGIKNLTKEE